jgi:hypothetical protein
MRIGKTPKKLDSICCPQHRETKADTLKQLRPIGEGDQELEKSLDQEELTGISFMSEVEYASYV